MSSKSSRLGGSFLVPNEPFLGRELTNVKRRGANGFAKAACRVALVPSAKQREAVGKQPSLNESTTKAAPDLLRVTEYLQMDMSRQ